MILKIPLRVSIQDKAESWVIVRILVRVITFWGLPAPEHGWGKGHLAAVRAGPPSKPEPAPARAISVSALRVGV